MQKPRFYFILPALLVVLSACTLRTRAAQVTPLVLPTATHMAITLPPTETSQPAGPAAEASATPQPDATATAGATVQVTPNLPATIAAQGVNLRRGPGTLFPSLGLLAEGTPITVTGKARGDDWALVDTGKLQGWVAVDFTSLSESGDIRAVPVKDTGDMVVIRGQVKETDGTSLKGIEFAAFQGKEDSNPPATRGHSLADGSFYLYLPAGSKGVWRISLTGVNCKSPIVDANCRYTGAFMPRFTDVTLPDDKVLEFQYTK